MSLIRGTLSPEYEKFYYGWSYGYVGVNDDADEGYGYGDTYGYAIGNGDGIEPTFFGSDFGTGNGSGTDQDATIVDPLIVLALRVAP